MKKEINKETLEILKESNESIIKLTKELNLAIHDYIKRGHINMAVVIGILDDLKWGISEKSRQIDLNKRFEWKRPEYIG